MISAQCAAASLLFLLGCGSVVYLVFAPILHMLRRPMATSVRR